MLLLYTGGTGRDRSAGVDLTPSFLTSGESPIHPTIRSRRDLHLLASGTLLETSCVETYRIANWTIDKKQPRTLRVVEDGPSGLTATITALSKTKLKLHQELSRSKEKQDMTLMAVPGEFVCPDMPK